MRKGKMFFPWSLGIVGIVGISTIHYLRNNAAVIESSELSNYIKNVEKIESRKMQNYAQNLKEQNKELVSWIRKPSLIRFFTPIPYPDRLKASRLTIEKD